MASDVDLCNQAISLAGSADLIQSMDEDSNEAKLCKTWYESLRDGLLRQGAYGFSRYTVALSKLTSGFVLPQQWAYAYGFPTDCVRLLGITRRWVDPSSLIPIYTAAATSQPYTLPIPSEPYEISALTDQSQEIVFANTDPLYMTYCRRITNVNLFDQGFADALVTNLAAKICYPLTNKVVRARDLAMAAKNMYDDAVADAANEESDNLSDTIPDHIADR